MKVRDLLNGKPSVVTVAPNAPLFEALSVMSFHKIGAVVMRGERGCPVRLVSERDVIAAISGRGRSILEESVQSVAPESCMHCQANDRLQDVMHSMNRHRTRHLPVLENGELVGIVSVGDLLKAQLEEMSLENRVLHDRALISAFANS